MDSLVLAELLCARLCHDMAGPVGAAAAGAELIAEMAGDIDAETLALVSASAGAGAARLKFFRSALGPAVGGLVSVAATRDQVRAYLDTQSSAVAGVGLEWTGENGSIDGGAARLLLNLVLLAKDSLPRGGRIAVEISAGRPRVTAWGDPVSLPDEARSILDGGAFPTSPRGAQAYLAQLLADQMTLAVKAELFPGGLGFSVAPSK
ncbi:conserved hypothetical protein [Magnetospirillum sp. LM-5]|uniref:histidine phosphotransferase family protein n=1 Tax=Magnetospirillum sp. LM-5 TaxID=2681466 RepID=UPI001382BA32|nr:histidine phosphotransferase family protein [Magnetospirillum sp. LM-5]CAA7618019.1 conserved hypothetical protein [Magnetospirillum sp. LM-5]